MNFDSKQVWTMVIAFIGWGLFVGTMVTKTKMDSKLKECEGKISMSSPSAPIAMPEIKPMAPAPEKKK